MKGSLAGECLYEAALLFSEIAEKDEEEIRAEDAKEIRSRCEKLLKYFKQCCKDHSIQKAKTREGIRNVVFLCSEAAKKVDKFGRLLKKTGYKNIMDSPEYRRLQSFYLKKISKSIDDKTLGKWVLSVSKELWGKERPIRSDSESKYVFIDLEGVKNDSEYELFFIKKEDGSRFFSPKLLRNIKLVSNLVSDKNLSHDPLVDLHVWKERAFYQLALDTYTGCKPSIDAFYDQNSKYKDSDLVLDLKKCLVALFLASRMRNLSHESGKKSIESYFKDFLMFYTQICSSPEYYRITHYPSHKIGKNLTSAINLIHDLGKWLFTSRFYAIFEPFIQHVIAQGNRSSEPDDSISSRITHDYKALVSSLRNHQDRTISKIIESAENNQLNRFDPLFEDNIPSELFKFVRDGKEICTIRLPSPTVQEYIHQAKLSDLFKTFLKSLQKDRERCLLINFQDRSSWKEASRSHALEISQDASEFENTLYCTTLSLDSSFYQQTSQFEKQNKAIDFMKSFENELLNTNNHYFCDDIKPSLETIVPGILETVHTLFFHRKNVLTKIERCQFIDMAYLLIIFKHIEIVSPNYISLVCKDGLDSSSTFNALMEIFLYYLSSDQIDDEAAKKIMNNLFTPTLIARERPLFKEKVGRLIDSVRALESNLEELKACAHRKKSEFYVKNLVISP